MGNCAGAAVSLGAWDDSGTVSVVCASTIGGAGSVSGALGLGAAAGGAAPGLRRAALGANFLPVVFSMCRLAWSVGELGATHY